jgi:hypothetical protein
MQTEKVDLENTVVDESRRQLNDQGTTSSSILRQYKFSGKFCNKKKLTERVDFVSHYDLYQAPMPDWFLESTIKFQLLSSIFFYYHINELSIS